MNNTIYRFQSGSSWSPRGGHHHFAGNLWSDITDKVYVHGKLKEDKSASPVEYPHHSVAYGSDVFHNIKGSFGVFENLPPVDQKLMKDFTAMEAQVKKRQTLNGVLGTSTNAQTMVNPSQYDMRLSPESAAIDKGCVHFVPWSLYAMVGEWNFYHDGKDVAKILDEHWYLNDYMTDRSTYHQAPQYPLHVVGVSKENYVAGPLESWVNGALQLNGKDQYAVLKNSALNKPFPYKKKKGRAWEDAVAQGSALKNAEIRESNFLIEIYFKSKKGEGESILVKKMGDTGYALMLNEEGGITFKVTGGLSAHLKCVSSVNDGRWHHVIAEADRAAQTLTIYIDGKENASGSGIGADSIASGADLFIGGSDSGPCLNGAIEFARICLGTLADARTTIDELYTWQFDGPQYRDFVGNAPTGRRDAGALELSK